jgi:hypothetical protein
MHIKIFKYKLFTDCWALPGSGCVKNTIRNKPRAIFLFNRKKKPGFSEAKKSVNIL